MAFAIQITEVGPAELPLIQTLRETIFSELGHTSRSTIAQQLSDQPDLLLLLAHLEGNPVGFAAGYRRTPEMFYLNHLAVLREYRKQGLGQSMLQQQIAFARARGYRRIEFNTFNHFPSMLRLGLSAGFVPIGLVQDEGTSWELAIRFAMNLKDDDPSIENLPTIGLDSDQIICPSEDAVTLRRALDAGFEFRGMLHEPGRQRPLMILHRIQR